MTALARSTPVRSLVLVAGLALTIALVPATPASADVIEVDTTQDSFDIDGPGSPPDCSLREAIFAANNDFAIDQCPAGDGADIVELDEDEEYFLDVNPIQDEEDCTRRGDLDIYEGPSEECVPIVDGLGEPSAQQVEDPLLVIQGHNSIVDGSGLEHCNVFHILGVSVIINNLTIQGGGGFVQDEGEPSDQVPRGGGILNEFGNLELNSSIVRGNVADQGGGIYNDNGSLFLHRSIVGDDDPEDGEDWGNLGRDFGGGIYTGVNEPATEVILDDSHVVGNVSGGSGGGIYNLGDEFQLINGSTVTGNVAGEGNSSANGGGIWTAQGNSLGLDEATVDGNYAARHGGGIYIVNDGVEIEDSTISGNTAGKICEDCPVTGGDGGGIWTQNECGDGCPNPTVLHNSTVSGNRALEPPQNNSGLGGGIYLNFEGEVILNSVTMNDNFADVAGGNIAIGDGGGAFVFLRNTIVTDGTIQGNEIIERAFAAAQEEELQNCATDGGLFVSFGFNLTDGPQFDCDIGDGSGDQFETDPQLGPLQLNAPGESATHALQPGSPAIDAGPSDEQELRLRLSAVALQPNDFACPDEDQRGIERPQDGDGDGIAVCDIGAYERRPQESGPEGEQPPPLPGPPSPDRLCDILGTTGNDILLGTDLSETLCGLAGDDVIRGRGGPDALVGDAGDDQLDGGLNNDNIDGGPGDDTGDYSAGPGPLDADLKTGVVTGEGASTDQVTRVENLIGTAFDDVLLGGAGANLLKGLEGNDVIKGRGDADRLRGGGDDDVLAGGKGADSIKGGKNDDLLKGNKESDTLGGGGGSDKLRGGTDDDTLRGHKGNDQLNGHSGLDDCDGGPGNNTILSCES